MLLFGIQKTKSNESCISILQVMVEGLASLGMLWVALVLLQGIQPHRKPSHSNEHGYIQPSSNE
jgi:hypothetical protein